jgi:hypothetical protein
MEILELGWIPGLAGGGHPRWSIRHGLLALC